MINKNPFIDLDENDRLLDLVYSSYRRVRELTIDKMDSETRHIAWTQKLWETLDITPWNWFPSITVAGSKGKGSTATMIASILSASGEKVGLITSPHMRSFRERIRINGQSISEPQLLTAIDFLESTVYAIASHIDAPQYLGPGGIIQALAFYLFKQADITICVVEAGRGGEFDESRLVRADVSVITRIMQEHIKFLGSSLQEIAVTKARITYPEHPLVVAPQDASIRSVLDHVACELHSPICFVQDSFSATGIQQILPAMTCDMTVGTSIFRNLELGMQGSHQIENAATAITAVKSIKSPPLHITDNAIRVGLQRIKIPGRFQQIQQKPLVIVDGAINSQTARQACTLFSAYHCRRRIAIIGIPDSKDMAGVCREVAAVVDAIIVTEVSSARLMWHSNSRAIAELYHSHVRHIVPADSAFRVAMEEGEENDGILIVGTQTLIANALHYWNVDTSRSW